jgi:hypothetical protein
MSDQSYLCAIGRMERVNRRRPDGLGETRGWLVLIGLCGLLGLLRLAVLIKLLGPFVRLGLARFLSTPLGSSRLLEPIEQLEQHKQHKQHKQREPARATPATPPTRTTRDFQEALLLRIAS